MTELIFNEKKECNIYLDESDFLNNGFTSDVFLYDKKYAIKLLKPTISKEIVEYEFNKLQIIANFADTPRALFQTKINDRNAIIFDYIHGISGLEKLYQNIYKIKNFAHEFAEIHFRIHNIEIDNNFTDEKTVLAWNINNNDLLTPEYKKIIIEYLNNLQSDNKLCHGDFHVNNTIYSEGKYYILDWITAVRGNPSFDVAITSILLKYLRPPSYSIFSKYKKIIILHIFYFHYIQHYLKISGKNLKEIKNWELPVMASRLKYCDSDVERKLLLKKIKKRILSL
jgi:aminoglycoside phosphotransferase (APT) family kinase protein